MATAAQTVPTQQTVMVQLQPATTTSNAQMLVYYKKVLFGLGATEFLLGFVCSLLGIVSLALAYDDRISTSYSGLLNIGQGLWCGIWITTAGLLGMLSGRKRASPHLIRAHMALSIVASIFSVFLFSLAIPLSIIQYHNNYTLIFANVEIALSVFGFVTFILCIVSSSYCCYTMSMAGHSPCCGNGCSACCLCCSDEPQPQGQAFYIVQPTTSNQQFVPAQQLNSMPQYVQLQPISNNGTSQASPGWVPMPTSPNQHAYAPPQSKQAEAQSVALTQDTADRTFPPSYNE